MDSVNLQEIDGRIIELARQRDDALNRCVVMAGQIAFLKKQIEEQKKTEEVTENAD